MAMSPPPPPPPPPHLQETPGSQSSSQEDRNTLMNTQPKSRKNYTLLLLINYFCLIVGSVAAALITKFYFIHNGSSRWVSTWVQSAGFPLLIPPVLFPYYLQWTPRRPFSGFSRRIMLLSVVVGVLLGLSNLLFSWGTSYLPVSTSSLLLSSQLVFNLILSVAIVKQTVTFRNLNCVILLTLSSVLLALSERNDRPPGLTQRQYWVGFFTTLLAGLTFAVYLPVMEKIYRKVYCYTMVVEMQLIMEFAATVFATVGMAADGGFTDFKTESLTAFDKGTAAYWWTIGGCLVVWQMSFMGTAGMVFLTTSLTGGICMTALMTVNVVAGVVVYGDKFGGVKAVSTVLCVWGFCSYLFGMYVKGKERKMGDGGGEAAMNELVVQS